MVGNHHDTPKKAWLRGTFEFLEYGSEGVAWVVRKAGTRGSPKNLQERKEPAKKDLKRLHA
ncbi:hypothetical protein MY4824_007509 [Beauveria thailandica]